MDEPADSTKSTPSFNPKTPQPFLHTPTFPPSSTAPPIPFPAIPPTLSTTLSHLQLLRSSLSTFYPSLPPKFSTSPPPLPSYPRPSPPSSTPPPTLSAPLGAIPGFKLGRLMPPRVCIIPSPGQTKLAEKQGMAREMGNKNVNRYGFSGMNL